MNNREVARRLSIVKRKLHSDGRKDSEAKNNVLGKDACPMNKLGTMNYDFRIETKRRDNKLYAASSACQYLLAVLYLFVG